MYLTYYIVALEKVEDAPQQLIAQIPDGMNTGAASCPMTLDISLTQHFTMIEP